MAVNPLQWNPIRANFGDATGMMQSAGQSIGRATDTVGNIFKQAQEAERQRLEQEQMLAQRAMEKERLGIARDKALREEEIYNTEREGSALGTAFFRDYQSGDYNNPKEFVKSIPVKPGTDPRILDTALNTFFNLAGKSKDVEGKDLDLATKRLNIAEGERKQKEYKALTDSGVSFNMPEAEFNTAIAKLNPNTQLGLIKTYKDIQRTNLDIERLKEAKEAKIKPEELDSLMIALNVPNTTLEQKNSILIDALLKHKDDPATVNALTTALNANYRAMGIEADRVKALANSLKGKGKFNQSAFNNSPVKYTQDVLKDFKYTDTTIEFLADTTAGIRKAGGDISPETLNAIYMSEEGMNTAETNWFTALFSGKIGQEKTLYGDEARLELSEISPFIEGTDIIDIGKPIGVKIIEAIKQKELEKGTPKEEIDNLPIIVRAREYKENKGKPNNKNNNSTNTNKANSIFTPYNNDYLRNNPR